MKNPPVEGDFLTFAAVTLSNRLRSAVRDCPDGAAAHQALLQEPRWTSAHPLVRRAAIYWTAQDAFHALEHGHPNLAQYGPPGMAWANVCFDILASGDGPGGLWPWSLELFEWYTDDEGQYQPQAPGLDIQSGAMAGLLLTYTTALQSDSGFPVDPDCLYCQGAAS